MSTSSDPDIAGVDRKLHRPEYVDPEIFGIARKKERSASTREVKMTKFSTLMSLLCQQFENLAGHIQV